MIGNSNLRSTTRHCLFSVLGHNQAPKTRKLSQLHGAWMIDLIRHWINLDWRSFFCQTAANHHVSLKVGGPRRLANSVGFANRPTR